MAKKATKRGRGSTKYPSNMVLLSNTAQNPKRKGTASRKQWDWMAKRLPATFGFLDEPFTKWAARSEFHSTLSQEVTWDAERHDFLHAVRDGQRFPKVAFDSKGDLLEAGATISGTNVVYQPGEIYHAADEVAESESESGDDDNSDDNATPADEPVERASEAQPQTPHGGWI